MTLKVYRYYIYKIYLIIILKLKFTLGMYTIDVRLYIFPR